jgi:hypothetical protein
VGPPGLCFLPRSSLPPGHNSSIPEMSNSNRPPAEPGVYLMEMFFSLPLFLTLISNRDQADFPMAPEKRDGMRRKAKRIRYL